MNFLVNARGSQKTAISVLEVIENGTISGLSGFRGEFPSEFKRLSEGGDFYPGVN